MVKVVYISLFFLTCSTQLDYISKTGNIVIEREYFENGNIQYESSYKFGKLDGVSKSWTEEGNIISSVEYKNGLLYGRWVTYYSSGQIKNSISYIDGKKNGKEIWYHMNGEKQSEVTYNMEVIISDIMRWDENGKEIIN